MPVSKTRLTDRQRIKIERLLLQGMPEKAQKSGISTSAWIAKKTDLSAETVAAYVANLNRTKNRLLVIESTAESKEQKSEGKHLKELLRIYNWNNAVKSRMVTVDSKNKFIETLSKAREWYVHISAHGTYNNKSKTTQIAIPHGSVIEGKDIENVWEGIAENRRPKLVVLAACECGHVDLIKAFNKAGIKECIAPLRKASWDDTALFNTLFYYYLFARRMSAWHAYRKTMRKVPDLEGTWRYFKDGKHRHLKVL